MPPATCVRWHTNRSRARTLPCATLPYCGFTTASYRLPSAELPAMRIMRCRSDVGRAPCWCACSGGIADHACDRQVSAPTNRQTRHEGSHVQSKFIAGLSHGCHATPCRAVAPSRSTAVCPGSDSIGHSTRNRMRSYRVVALPLRLFIFSSLSIPPVLPMNASTELRVRHAPERYRPDDH